MALDVSMDDLIGSMQHGFHAGDRGRELQQIRDGLAFALAPQGLGAPQRAWTGAFSPAPPSSLDGSAASLMNGHAQPMAFSRAQAGHPGGAAAVTTFDPSSLGSTGSSAGFQHSGPSRPAPIPARAGYSSRHHMPSTPSQPGSLSSGSGGGSFGLIGSHAPANTPMQTPVDRDTGTHWARAASAAAAAASSTPSASSRQVHMQMSTDDLRRREPLTPGQSGSEAISSDGAGRRTPIHQGFAFGIPQGGAPPNSPAQHAFATSDAGTEWSSATDTPSTIAHA